VGLIYRSLFDVENTGIVEAAPSIFREWLVEKARRAGVDAGALESLETRGEPVTVGAWTVSSVADSNGALAAFGGRLVEKIKGQVLTTSLRVVSSSRQAWADIDLEREWVEGEEFGASWVPLPPGLVRTVLGSYSCTRAGTPLTGEVSEINRESTEAFLQQLLDPGRDLPYVVVTRSEDELASKTADKGRERAGELARRLAGIAQVALFGPMVAQDFSKLIGGAPWDVHSGAVRSYLPGLLRDGDQPQWHRIVHFRRLRDQPAGTAARLTAGRLIEAAIHRKLPESWGTVTTELPRFAPAQSDRDWEEIAEDLDKANAHLKREAEALDQAFRDVQEQARERVADALVAVERYQAREGYLRSWLNTANPDLDIDGGLLATEESTVHREHCTTVVGEAQSNLKWVVFYDPAKVLEGADLLDENSQPVFALNGWQALTALNEYAEKKASEKYEGSFMDYCRSGLAKAAISSSWVAMKESGATGQTRRFREQRTFQVPEEVDASGKVYMEAHIKLEEGGYPAPRIHFHDDTRGKTRMVYVGWFGPHLPNKSKN